MMTNPKVADTIGSEFLPSEIKIGEILLNGDVPDCKDKVLKIDMYGDRPDRLLGILIFINISI